MKTRIVEATNGPSANWGKFMICQFTQDEWDYRSKIDGGQLIARRGWTPEHLLVVDLQTGEGAIFRPGGYAKYDLDKHRIWVCPLFEHFLQWLYDQPSPMDVPELVDLPSAPFDSQGYRREGPCPPSE